MPELKETAGTVASLEVTVQQLQERLSSSQDMSHTEKKQGPVEENKETLRSLSCSEVCIMQHYKL